jgi:phosphoribosylaminoimidazole-succinocarboxamide synthase
MEKIWDDIKKSTNTSNSQNPVNWIKTGVSDALSWKNDPLQYIYDAIDSGLWPKDKKITNKRGWEELENLWYKLFYEWKNADLYVIPGDPDNILMIRTDRTSVFDIPLDLEIEWKWVVQNQLWLFGASFAKDYWVAVANSEVPSNIPDSIKKRAQVIRLWRILSIERDGEEVWLELIYRNYLTGSLFKKYKNWEDPYNLKLPKWLDEWHKFDKPKFTPTTKEKTWDEALDPKIVMDKHGEIIKKIWELFEEFTRFVYERWYVLVDNKFEAFIDPKTWKWFLWDEILTPESGRYITVENFNAGRYIPEDKQVIRKLWLEFWWIEKWLKIKEQHPEVKFLNIGDDVTGEDKKRVINGYQGILDALSGK